MSDKRLSVIIVGGGQGLRMGKELPKQFIPLHGKPILMHTMACFNRWDPTIEFVLVLPETHYDYWKMICEELSFSIPHKIVFGGESRFHSVRNGLQAVVEGELIAVHDGVRPVVSQQIISSCFKDAAQFGAAIPVTPMIESVREVKGEESHWIDRSRLCVVQTPQVFRADWLRQAYEQGYNPSLTDDASLVEAAGYRIHLSEGSPENIKITTPSDLQVAECLLATSNY